MDQTPSIKSLIIAVDCDDVLVPTTPFFVDAYNKLYGTNVPLDQAHISSDEFWQADEALIGERLAELTLTQDYKELGPSPVEVSVLKELARHHELHLVTARKEVERAFTQSMLDRDLSGVFTSMEFVGWGGSKGEVCKRLGADVLIDDNARHLHDAIAEGLPKNGAILFGNYPWNSNDSKHDDLTHCHNWPEVANVVQSLAQLKEAS